MEKIQVSQAERLSKEIVDNIDAILHRVEPQKNGERAIDAQIPASLINQWGTKPNFGRTHKHQQFIEPAKVTLAARDRQEVQEVKQKLLPIGKKIEVRRQEPYKRIEVHALLPDGNTVIFYIDTRKEGKLMAYKVYGEGAIASSSIWWELTPGHLEFFKRVLETTKAPQSHEP